MACGAGILLFFLLLKSRSFVFTKRKYLNSIFYQTVLTFFSFSRLLLFLPSVYFDCIFDDGL